MIRGQVTGTWCHERALLTYLGIRKCLPEEVTLDLRLKGGPVDQGLWGRKNAEGNKDDICKGPGAGEA